MNSKTNYLSLFLLVMVCVLPGCSRHDAAGASNTSQSAPQAITLSAALLSPTDVKLTWSDPGRGTAGYIVEFATEPKGEYTTLGFLQPDQQTFIHPRLMPDTTWYYRVRPYYGPASNPVDVALPDRLSDKEYAARFKRPEDYGWATPRTIPDPSSVSKLSLRSTDSALKAAPADLKAALVPTTVSGFLLTWSARSSDEEGYLIEMKSDRE